MRKPNFLKWFIFLLLAAAVVLLLTACSASKKNVNIHKSHVDSTATEVKKDSRVSITDSINKKIKNSTYSRETEYSYVPYEIDSADAPINPGDGILVINSPHSGKKIVFVPNIKIKESGTKAREENTHLQKKDSASVEIKKEVTVKKEEKIIEKKKEKKGFNWWLLLWLLPLVIFLPKVKKYILNKLT